MTNSKAVREQAMKDAGYIKLPNGKWVPADAMYAATVGLGYARVCFTCKSCWRRSLQSDLNNLQCPFCGSAMHKGRKPQ